MKHGECHASQLIAEMWSTMFDAMYLAVVDYCYKKSKGIVASMYIPREVIRDFLNENRANAN